MAETLNLAKGQKVPLSKDGETLTKLCIGLGWSENKGNGPAFDADAFCVCLDSQNKAVDGGTLYYGSPKNSSGKPSILSESLLHSGDNLTGKGDGDDETITIDLTKVPENVNKIIFAVNIYEAASRNQNFGMIRDAYLAVYDPAKGTDYRTRTNILKYDLGEEYSTFQGVVFGEVYRHNGEWKFGAVSNGFNGTINDCLQMF